LSVIINVANEYAINLFKNKKIKFTEIISLINKCINKFPKVRVSSFKQIYDLQTKITHFLDSQCN
jgi:1-deoxy-D-xylulose-5-phosphate reductoisomerase